MASLKFGYNLEGILKHADTPVDMKACGFREQVIAGVFLDKGTKKFMVDKPTNSNKFIMYAPCFKITWIEDTRYWKWISVPISPCGKTTKAAELIKVSWLDICGVIDASMFSPNIGYQVAFEILIRKTSCGGGWGVPVNLQLKLPNGTVKECKEDLKKLPTEKWVEITVATFKLTEADLCSCSNVEFRLYEHGTHWKTGLVFKCAHIRPIANPIC